MSIDWNLIGPPLLAGLLVISTHVVLGREVLKRGIIFIDLCIAQVAALGVVVAHAMHLLDKSGLIQITAIVSALLAAALLAWTERQWPRLQEAIIGSLYVVSASAALLVLSHDPHGAEQLNRLLAGQVLWVAANELVPLTISMGIVLAAWAFFPSWRHAFFYFLFAIAITASVQIIGVFLVFASLILPALATLALSERNGLIAGYILGASGYGFGLGLSLILDLPAGPLIVCSLAALGLVFAAVRQMQARH